MLPKENRLKKKKEFEAIFENGRTVKGKNIIVRYLGNGLEYTKVGFIVSKKVSKKAVEIGESELSISAITEGDEAKVSFNYHFILDALTNIKSSEISFEMQGNDRPALIKPVGDASYLYVVMPIRI
jgi:DNA polymerase III sliding clamp (beta) subunit (PCNA family)